MKRLLSILVFMVFLVPSMQAQASRISDKTNGMKKYPGYFNFYWDANTGKIWLEIDKLDREFLYVSSLPAGLGSNNVGLDRNQLGATRIVRFQRIGPRILLIQSNYSFRADSDNPDEQKAVRDAFAPAVQWGFSIAAEEDGKVLVDASSFLLRDVHNAIGSLRRRNQGNFRLDGSRSAIYLPHTKNFPLNTEFEVILTLTSENPGNYVRQVAADAQAVTLRQHHSFIQLPDDDYQPRIYDPRSNFGAHSYNDYATPIESSLTKRFIRRHRLKKKDPSAEISDPVKPIVYYIDRGAPEPIRTALVEGARWWNQAFEAIGYRNAFQVEVLPEGADPMDIRYNMVNWVHRSTRGWSYGASVTDPRTGEIIKGHVALGSLRIRQDFLIAQGLTGDYSEAGSNAGQLREMALARIRQLSCHEVGHTLGMGHNYAASTNDRASVMDYPHMLIKIDDRGEIDLSDAYATGIGEWDKVSIAYGYRDFPPGVDEEAELRSILDQAFSSGLVFLASQDAGPDSAHPLAATWDNGKNPVDELERMLKVRKRALDTFSERRIPLHTPLSLLEDVLVPVYLFHRYQVEAAASTLGGLDYSHKLRGDVQGLPRIIIGAEQRRALKVLLRTLSPTELALPERILGLIPPRAPGYRGGEVFPGYTGSTFDPLGAAESAAGLTVGLILHPQRAARLVEFHSREPDSPGLGEVIDGLVKNTWGASHGDAYHSEIQRTVNIVALKHILGLAVDEGTSPQARAVANLKLQELWKWLKGMVEKERDQGQRAHFSYGLSLIEWFQRDPQQFILTRPLSPPAGAPIGTLRR